MNEPETLSTPDAARILGIRVRELYRMIDDGELPSVKVGRHIRVQRDDLPS